MIDKRMFFYWGADKMSWLRYLSIYTFIKHNPDWETILVIPYKLSRRKEWSSSEQTGKYTGNDYTEQAKSLVTEVRVLNMKDLNSCNEMSEVYKSDIARNWLVWKYGGVYSDTDIIWTKPLTIDDEVTMLVSYNKCYYSIGLIGGEKDNRFFKDLYDKSIKASHCSNYQGFGNMLYPKEPPERLRIKYYNNIILSIPKVWIYSIEAGSEKDIFNESELKLDKEAIGLHWFGGHPISRDWENKLFKEENYNNLLCRTIKEALK